MLETPTSLDKEVTVRLSIDVPNMLVGSVL
jgi:hypothetical protein